MTEPFDHAKWKPPELDDVVAHDPFALPDRFPQPATETEAQLAADGSNSGETQAELKARLLTEAVERYRQQLEELQQRGVQVILSKQNQYVAMVGDRTLHVGDEINGFTVTAIEADGVRVERKGIE